MKFESALITRILDTGDWKSARGLTADHFFSPDGRQAWNFIKQYVMEHNQTPSRELLEDQVPSFQFPQTIDAVPALVERVNDYFLYNQLNLMNERVATVAGNDVMAAISVVNEYSMRLRSLVNQASGISGVDLTKQVDEERADYFMRKNLKGVLGLPFPWPRLNKATFGIMDGQFIVFYARPKNMKSFLLLYVLQHVHYMCKRRPVLFTREMTTVELRHRYVAMLALVDYERYLRGQLTQHEEQRWEEALETLGEMSPIIIDQVPGIGEEAADNIIQKAQEYGADFLGIDGIYFYGNREWDQIAAFSTRIKYHLLNTIKIPCVATTQGAKKKTGNNNADDIGYGDSILQDADMVIKCAYVPEDQKIYLSLPAIREGRSCEFSVWGKPCTDFSQAAENDFPDKEGGEDPGSNEDGDKEVVG